MIRFIFVIFSLERSLHKHIQQYRPSLVVSLFHSPSLSLHKKNSQKLNQISSVFFGIQYVVLNINAHAMYFQNPGNFENRNN